jgi:hypothetical protein
VRSIELDGIVSGVAGTCPAISFVLDGHTVISNSATRVNGGNCRGVRNGAEVEVRGTLMSDGTVLADTIRLDDDD